MTKFETTITLPCDVGHRFWIFDRAARRAIHVECTGYVISRDVKMERDAAYIWCDSIDGTTGNWRIPFHEFDARCFNTRKEAERSK